MHRSLLVCWLAAVACASGCTEKNPSFCESNADCTSAAAPFCDIEGAFGDRNQCTPAPVPDAGESDATAPRPDAATGLQPLDITLGGTGTGRVTSNPAGIDCPGTCSAEFEAGTDVVLAAAADPADVFVTWAGDCPAGFSACTVRVAGPVSVGATFGTPNEPLWARAIGGDGSDVANDVAADLSGNAVVVGAFGGTVDFGVGAPLTAEAGTTDGYVAKYASDGTPLWATHIGGTGDRGLIAVSLDDAGDAYVSGTRTSGVLLARIRGADGAIVWQKDLAATGSAAARGIGVANGQVAITGDLTGTMDFGGGSLTAASPGADLFISWYTDEGAYVRSALFGAANADFGNDIAVSPTGDVFITGFISSNNVDFGGGPLVTFDFTDVFVVKFSSTGAHQWSKTFLGNGIDITFSVAIDGAGNPYLVGTHTSPIDFGGGSLPVGSGGTNTFVAALDGATGAHRWSFGLGTATAGPRTQGLGIATSPRGTVTVVGNFEGAVNFGGGTITAVGATDMFVATYDTDGNHVRSIALGSSDDTPDTGDVPFGIASDPAGRTIVVGGMFDAVSFGAGAVTSNGGADGFAASFGPGG